ncbi:hypothetical protein V8U11_09250 [Pseudomonas chlororaphis]|uniref:hypothetical protein n=1 Tax=Pseudomonas chlororaphis TaxID=587753 RepID=UPI0030CB38BE
MAISPGHPDVQLLLSCFLRVEQSPINQLWSVWLDPHTLAGFTKYPLPPGQEVGIGADDYDLYYNDVFFDRLNHKPAFKRYKEELWAVLPRFHSHETAYKMGMWWLNINRPDLVKACQSEATAGIAWRAAQERKRGEE